MRSRLLLVALSCCMLTTTAFASTSKLNAVARQAVEKLRSKSAQAVQMESPGVVTELGEIDCFITGDVTRAELEAAGAKIRTALPGVFTAYIPLDAIERVAAIAKVRTIEGAVRAEQELDKSVPTTNADGNRGFGPSFLGVNGEGVIVGDVDSGIDYGHGDFDDPGGNTRIVNIWDQTGGGGVPPVGFGYGSEWSNAQIDANTATEVDLSGHGTHVMGIAAGDGSQTGGGVPAHTYAGMAPKADIIMVKTTFSTSAILDGVAYVFDRATALGKPAVCNLSLGSHFGPHDGSSAFEAGLSALTGPGRILVKSAGNSGGDDIHAERIVGAGDTDATLLVSGSSLSAVMAIIGYYNSTENLTVTVHTPDGATVGPVTRGNSTIQGTPMDGTVTLQNGVSTTSNGDYEVYFEAQHTTGSMNGTWTFEFSAVSTGATNGEVDLWRYFASPSNLVPNFVLGNQPDDEVISEPGNADSAITVGSWTSRTFWQDCAGNFLNFIGAVAEGQFTPFSSSGPTRDGRIKPDISAPGSAIASTITTDVFQSCNPGGDLDLGDGLNHTINQGTSMSAPHVTGAVALLLQKDPQLTPSEVKAYFTNNAVVDGPVGAVPNNKWGGGKLRLGDLMDPLATITAPNGGEVLVHGQNVDVTWLAADNIGVTTIDIRLSRDGGSNYEDIALGEANDGTYTWNVAGAVTTDALFQVTANDAAGNTGSDVSNAVFEISTGVSAPNPGAVAEFALGLLSSNPARGPVDIEFAVPTTADLSVALFDLQGRMIETLASGEHAPGRYNVRWNGRQTQSGPGIYFVRMKAAERELVQRIVVIQ